MPTFSDSKSASIDRSLVGSTSIQTSVFVMLQQTHCTAIRKRATYNVDTKHRGLRGHRLPLCDAISFYVYATLLLAIRPAVVDLDNSQDSETKLYRHLGTECQYYLYTVNIKNVTFYFLTITLANLNRFL